MLKSEFLKRIRTFLLVFILFSMSLASYSQYESFVFDINGTNLQFLSANRTLIHDGGNNGHLAGSIWRYDNLISTHGVVIYGILTVKEIVNATITDFDNETSGLAERFQPFISTSAAGGYVLYELEFYETYTDQKVYISNYYLTSVDIDGREFVEIGGYSTYDVDETCGLTITHDNARHLTRFSGITNSISNITFENTAAFVAHYVFPYTKVTFSLGSEIQQGERQFSVQFGAAGGVFSNPNTIRNPLKLMYLSKTANNNLFAGGSQRRYYIDIENVGGTADSITLSDVLPAGITYVENSTKIVVPAASVIETIADQFSLAQYGLNSGSEHWTTEWIESAGEDGSPTGGNITITSSRLRFNNLPSGRYIERSLDLHRADQASLTFDYPAIALSSGALSVQLSIDGNTFVDITTLSGTTAGSFTYNIPSIYFVENLTIRFVNAGGNWANGRNISIDNVKFTYSYSQPELTKTNALAGGTLIDGNPDNILTPADNIVLLPGVTARVSFDVDVDCSIEGLIENTAKLSCPNLYTDEIIATHIAYANPYYINHDAVCQDGIVTISATGEDDGQVFRWYDAETGGNLLGTGSTFETPYIDTNTDYWVAFYNPITGCESGRTLVTAIVSTGITGTGQIINVAGTAGQNGSAEISENGASASTSGSPSWSNPNNAIGGNDNQRASVALGNRETSGFLDINFPDLNIPSGIDIKGITVSIDRYASGNNVRDNT
ncbi:MAG: hypothetical protein GX879_03645, partial [Bacteroidales bacterium]|nr:hypothetical protein [Bacteroidales bacterium]